MIFDKRRKKITIQKQEIVIAEMDALNFTKMLEMENESESIFFLISQSIESPTCTVEEVKTWPSSIINKLTEECVKLNNIDNASKKK